MPRLYGGEVTTRSIEFALSIRIPGTQSLWCKSNAVSHGPAGCGESSPKLKRLWRGFSLSFGMTADGIVYLRKYKQCVQHLFAENCRSHAARGTKLVFAAGAIANMFP